MLEMATCSKGGILNGRHENEEESIKKKNVSMKLEPDDGDEILACAISLSSRLPPLNAHEFVLFSCSECGMLIAEVAHVKLIVFA